MSVDGKGGTGEDVVKQGLKRQSGGGTGEGPSNQNDGNGSDHGDHEDRDAILPLDLPADIVEAVKHLSMKELRQRILRSSSPVRPEADDHALSNDGGSPTPPSAPPSLTGGDTDCHYKTKSMPFRDVMDLLREERALWDKMARKQQSDRPTRRHVLPPKPASYDGLTHGEVFLQDYISFIEDSTYDEAVNEDFVMSFPAFLTGRARAWYKRLNNDDKKDWSLLLDLFKERFISHFTNAARKSYKRRMQGEHESVAEYSLDMDELMTAACVNPEEMLVVYISNLRECLSEQVQRHNPKDVREAEKVALEIEASFLASATYTKTLLKHKSKPLDSQLAQRIADRLQSLEPSNPQQVSDSSPDSDTTDLEERLVSKVLERLQKKGRPNPPRHTVASLDTEEGPNPPGKKNKNKKKKKAEAAQAGPTTGPPVANNTPNAHMFQPVPYPFYPPFPGPGMFPFPPPTQQPKQSQNQGN